MFLEVRIYLIFLGLLLADHPMQLSHLLMDILLLDIDLLKVAK